MMNYVLSFGMGFMAALLMGYILLYLEEIDKENENEQRD